MTNVRSRVAAFCAVAVLAAVPASAQLNSSEASAVLTAVLPESLTVTLLPAATSFALTSGSSSNSGALPLSATTTWTLALTRTSLKLYGYFTDSTAALAHTYVTNTSDIPSARVEASVNGGTAAAFDQTTPFGGASAGLLLFTQSVSVPTASGSRTDSIALNINLNSYPLPADTYVGTLRIRAQATP